MKSYNDRIIFGLKLRQIRLEKNLSFAELADATGVSASYLNEIEKGKKYPRENKIELLAKALGTDVLTLTSMELKQNLAPIGDLLQSNFLNELPLELFGIELSKVVDIIANAPLRVGAFISTLVELSRNYALREEHFYFGVLRSYLELHNNYFEEIEEAVITFSKDQKIPTTPLLSVSLLGNLLEHLYNYKVVENGLDAYPDLQSIRSIYLPQKKKLLLNSKLNDMQRAFQFGKELGFNYLNLKERAYTASLLRVKTFEEALNHFKAGYFSAALLINRDLFVRDIRDWLAQKHWQPDFLPKLLQKYQASPEMLFQRLTNILPSNLGLCKIFFLRIIHDTTTDMYEMSKELHLNRRHYPHSSGLEEHYCRRWVSVDILKQLKKTKPNANKQTIITAIQRSKHFHTEDEYLCISLASTDYPSRGRNVSVTLGILLDKDSISRIRFLSDGEISSREVNQTCERCSITDCVERAAPPIILEKRKKRQLMQESIKKLLSND